MVESQKPGTRQAGVGIAFPAKGIQELETHLSGDGKSYLDRFAATGLRFRRVTPEETVRQQFVEFLRRDVGVPDDMLKTEDAVSHYAPHRRGRADIVGFAASASSRATQTTPLFVVECKQPGWPLDDEVKGQVVKYARDINARFAITTNGTELCAYRIQHRDGALEGLAAMPRYDDMLENRVRQAAVRAWRRPPHAKLATMSREEIRSDERLGGCVGKSTPDGVARLTVELASLLLDDSTKPCQWSAKDGGFRMHALGLRHVTPRNPSGGSWTGMYRYWLVRGKPEGDRLVGLALLSAWNGKSTLLLTTDQPGRTAAVLELALDDFVNLSGNPARLYHNGRMRGGVKGATMEAMLDWIADHAPHLLGAGHPGAPPQRRRHVDLGVLPLDCRLKWGDIRDFVVRCTEYGFAREAFTADLTTSNAG